MEGDYMNNQRRKRINKLKEQLSNLITELQDIQMDEEMAYDNMPEGLQCSQRGMDSEDAIACMGDANESLEDASNSIEEAINALDEIM